jgi:hypothetical protein
VTRPLTFDLLDAHFIKENKRDYKSLKSNPRFASSKEEVIIDPQYWEDYYPLISTITFNWKEFKYSSRPNLNKLITNDDPGMYIFYIKPPNTILDMPKFVLYVGISNENNSNRPLKVRLSEYFRVKEIKKRSSLHRLLVKYYDYTYVAFSTLQLNTAKIKALETSVLGFFYPLTNKDDFPVEIKAPKKAFNRR